MRHIQYSWFFTDLISDAFIQFLTKLRSALAHAWGHKLGYYYFIQQGNIIYLSTKNQNYLPIWTIKFLDYTLSYFHYTEPVQSDGQNPAILSEFIFSYHVFNILTRIKIYTKSKKSEPEKRTVIATLIPWKINRKESLHPMRTAIRGGSLGADRK